MTPEERERQWDVTIEIVRQVRNEIIEECARVVETYKKWAGFEMTGR